MGRYYSGDIEGKFWFAVQSSNAADRFGVEGSTPSYLTYFYSKEDLPMVVDELKSIEVGLGDNFDKMKDFFSTRSYYNDNELLVFLGLDDTPDNMLKIRHMLKEYADHDLGTKIKNHLEENDYCEFDAEF